MSHHFIILEDVGTSESNKCYLSAILEDSQPLTLLIFVPLLSSFSHKPRKPLEENKGECFRKLASIFR
jgi:hypothetical protein